MASLPITKTKIIGDYKIENKLGSGQYASVWKGIHQVTQQVVAIKVIIKEKYNNKKLIESLDTEIEITRSLKHENIVNLINVISNEKGRYILLEYCSGGDLAQYIKLHGKVDETTCKHFMLQIAKGLYFLHKHDIMHRDLKPHNLLLTDNSLLPTVKIADFGFAKSLLPSNLANTLCGSPLYMAPEILSYQRYDSRADVWSCGVIMYELLVGKPPYHADNPIELLRRIEKSDFVIPSNINLSPSCLNLLTCLLKRKYTERYTAYDLIQHPFLQSVLSEDERIEFSRPPSVPLTNLIHRPLSPVFEHDDEVADISEPNSPAPKTMTPQSHSASLNSSTLVPVFTTNPNLYNSGNSRPTSNAVTNTGIVSPLPPLPEPTQTNYKIIRDLPNFATSPSLRSDEELEKDYVIVTELESTKSAKPSVAPSSTSSRRASFNTQFNNTSPQLTAIAAGASHYIKNNLPGFIGSNILMSSYKEIFELLGIWYKQAIFVLELANQIYSNNPMSSSVNNSPAASQFLSSEYSQSNSLLASKERSFILHLHSCHICELILYMIQQWGSYQNIQLNNFIPSTSTSIIFSPQINPTRHPFTSPLAYVPNYIPSSLNVSPALKPTNTHTNILPQIGNNELKQVMQFQTIISQLFTETLKKCDNLSNFLTLYQNNGTESSSVFEQKGNDTVESAIQIIYNYSIRMSKRACSEELDSQYQTAYDHFRQAYYLFQHLMQAAVDPTDRDTLGKYMQECKRRREYIHDFTKKNNIHLNMPKLHAV